MPSTTGTPAECCNCDTQIRCRLTVSARKYHVSLLLPLLVFLEITGARTSSAAQNRYSSPSLAANFQLSDSHLQMLSLPGGWDGFSETQVYSSAKFSGANINCLPWLLGSIQLAYLSVVPSPATTIRMLVPPADSSHADIDTSEPTIIQIAWGRYSRSTRLAHEATVI
jgi:hypothetical protein